MKAFDELTDAELIELTDKDIDRYVDVVCAEEGTPLLPTEAPQPPGKDDVIPDVTLFCVGGFEFFKRHDAEKVRDMLTKVSLAKTEYIQLDGYRTDYNRRQAVPEYEVPDITEKKFFSADLAGRMKTKISRFEEDKTAYETAKRDYDKIANRRSEIARGFRNQIAEAQQKDRRRKQLEAELQRYLDLAEGNQGIALRFLEKAHSDARDVLADIYAGSPAMQVDAVVGGLAEQAA